jgi:hypothetical protein
MVDVDVVAVEDSAEDVAVDVFVESARDELNL